MEQQIKRKMLIAPLVLTIAGLVFGLVFVFLIQHFLTQMLEAAAKTHIEASFPPVAYIFMPLAFAIPGLKALLSNWLLLSKWQRGIAPTCPTCGYPMRERVARRGQYLGQRFWGCYRFPRCTGKIHIG